MIIEGLLTTLNADAKVNISPMGPFVDGDMRRFVLRPYQTSTTYANLCRTGQGVFHVSDDVLMLAKAAVGHVEPPPQLLPADAVEGYVLAGACRWYALNVQSIDDSQPRSEMVAEVADTGRLRDFIGFNRAKHAVVEAAILATRIKLLSADEILQEYEKLSVLVDKTGGPDEKEAFEFLENYIRAAPDTRRLMDE